jgi:hypothetical protein
MPYMTKKWKVIHRILKLQSPWVTVYADKIEDDTGKELEYWHYDRADSVIVIVIQDGKFLLPAKVYRVGIDEIMLDFAGGRIGDGQTPEEAAIGIMQKELGVPADLPMKFKRLTTKPLAVDSSFSSQRLYGLVVEIPADVPVADGVLTFPYDSPRLLRKELYCVQCRLVLDEYLLQ